jgi:hypothetical protein
LIELLNQEANGEIDAISEYIKQTLKSFVAFIKNNFRSYVEEEIKASNKGPEYFDSIEEAIAKGNETCTK